MTGLRLLLTFAAVPLLSVSATAQQVPPWVRTGAACAPVGAAESSASPRVLAMPVADGGSVRKTLFVVGERVGLDRGADAGMELGARLVVRRPMRFEGAPIAQHTIGWLRVTEVNERGAIAEVDAVCTAIAEGDVVEPAVDLVLPPGVTRTFVGGSLEPQRFMRVSYGTDGRSANGDRDFVLADREAGSDVVVGERYAAFHRGAKVDDTNPPVAEAVVVAVFPRQVLLRVTQVRDAIFAGDRFVLRVGASDPRGQESARATAPTAVVDEPIRVGGSAEDRMSARSSDAATADQRVVLEDLYFGLDRYSLRPEARRTLDDAVKKLKADPTLRVRIEGHTCNLGTAEHNLALGQRRADAVRAYLATNGIAESRLTTVSFGEEHPMHDNATKDGRRLNRRAVLSVSLQR